MQLCSGFSQFPPVFQEINGSDEKGKQREENHPGRGRQMEVFREAVGGYLADSEKVEKAKRQEAEEARRDGKAPALALPGFGAGDAIQDIFALAAEVGRSQCGVRGEELPGKLGGALVSVFHIRSFSIRWRRLMRA